jgi:hypothetical protein
VSGGKVSLTKSTPKPAAALVSSGGTARGHRNYRYRSATRGRIHRGGRRGAPHGVMSSRLTR